MNLNNATEQQNDVQRTIEWIQQFCFMCESCGYCGGQFMILMPPQLIEKALEKKADPILFMQAISSLVQEEGTKRLREPDGIDYIVSKLDELLK